jgi:transcription-repair coupling factor (superfamily II helicase)
LNIQDILAKYANSRLLKDLSNEITKYDQLKVHLKGLKGSSKSLITSALHQNHTSDKLIICADLEEAQYMMNDLESFIGEQKIHLFPAPYKDFGTLLRYNPYTLERIDILNNLKKPTSTGRLVVTYPEALIEYVATQEEITENTSFLKVGNKIDDDFIIEFLIEYGFERTDFVSEAGFFSIRGGIIDIFSYGNNLPYRIELLDDEIESIREFDPESQLSVRKMDSVTIIPNMETKKVDEKHIPVFEYLNPESLVFFNNLTLILDKIDKFHEKLDELFDANNKENPYNRAQLLDSKMFLENLDTLTCLNTGTEPVENTNLTIEFDFEPQPSFNKNFNILADTLIFNQKNFIQNFIFSESPKQIERIYAIFEDKQLDVKFIPIYKNIHNGFVDKKLNIACFTEHEIFNRYHKSRTRKVYSKDSQISLKELYELKPGDYITHINHGIGRFSGLQKIDIGGKKQEAIRLEYAGGDLLYVSIHSMHKISRFTGKEGREPKLHRLGSKTWDNLKNRTKKKVKDIARDLIKLYAARKAQTGFSFTQDTYLQTELEASFIYEDTPDQAKSTDDIKYDMEQAYPMDRLICGDVGYGKTEVAIRAAFKAVADSKQVAILVPTTILAFQHYKTFTDRLSEFPASIDYLSRFKNARQTKEIKQKLAEGKIDIVIGTHKLLAKDIKFKDLGLLIIDEEQKFGVAAKEKLRSLKVNVDTLSLTATPIPRTLQFSLMGVRDLSTINTPPPNRQAVETHLKVFDNDTIKEAIEYEVERGGQVFFVHNRIKDLDQIEGIISELVPQAKIGKAHGRMESKDLEEIMLNFIDGYYDVLLSTNIIESGLDIPNANTIIINEAQNFGLSDLYQMRGRVGRSNIKAYCYLLIPSFTVISSDARKRLSAIEEFTDLGSGFHIAMRDLDIRGAGNLLGAEQSGFITDIGIDMYKKILDEALQELRNDEFKDLFADARQDKVFFNECQIDTDLEVLIPDHYVNNIEERLSLYNKLNKVETEKDLRRFEKELIDRFGKIPYQTNDLLDLIRLKWVAQNLGITKIFLKNKKFKAFFPFSQAKTDEFQTKVFEKVLKFNKSNHQKCKFREKENGIDLIIESTRFVDEALEDLKVIEKG